MRAYSFIAVFLVMLSMTAMAASDPAPAKLSFVSVQALKEGISPQKVFDKDLQNVRKNIEKLNYRTFKKISSASAPVPFGKPSKFIINDTYTLIVEPTKIDKQGRIQLKIQVMKKKKAKDGTVKTVKALETIPWMAPGKRLNIAGLKLKEGGDLIIVLSVK